MAYSKAYATVSAIGKEPMLRISAMLMTVAALVSSVEAAARPKEQPPGTALEARQKGRILPLPSIEARVRQLMPDADYLGPELDMDSGLYRLKFVRGERVIWIDVDARTGQIVGRSGR